MTGGMLFVRPSAACFKWQTLKLPTISLSHSLHHLSTLQPRGLTFQEIDTKWRGVWAEKAHGEGRNSNGSKAYILSMFPYPSGSLHMGHLRVYTISDVLARYKRMSGNDVLHPMGWDAFGLPAENAAIERGIDPAVWTKENILKMKEQLVGMNAHFDWSREFMTCSPSFYKHTQKIFLMLHKRGLAYQAEALVNYDPVDKTVLANEQVDANGRSWRSGAVVQQLKLKQWFLRITAFKEALLDDLASLNKNGNWPERVVLQQRHWLGKSTGAKIRFALQVEQSNSETVEVFTTRPDTLYGVKYLALSTAHSLVQRLSSQSSELRAFLDHAASLPSDSKAGFLLPGVVARNPLGCLEGDSGDSCDRGESLPVYTAPYVLGDYGEGAVMGVPGHDTRDLAFWREQGPSNPVSIVIESVDQDLKHDSMTTADCLHQAFTLRGRLNELCGPYAGLESTEAGQRIVSDLNKSGNLGDFAETWRLRDWLVSRQRYWGTPIPIVHCDKCGAVPVPIEQLPVELPQLDDSLKGKPGNPLQALESWVHTDCPSCHGPAKRDTDTMDTFVDSSWYFLRFPNAHNEDEPFSAESAESMLPVDTYVGGVEHAILHLLYARFIYKFLASEGLIPQSASGQISAPEPFRQLISQGMVHGKTFSDPQTGRFLHPNEVEGADTPNPTMKASGTRPAVTWEKMSKSKHNGVDPSLCIARYGADATRAHILFSAPVSEILEWDEEKIVGIQRWFHRISRLVSTCRLAYLSQLDTVDPSSVPLPDSLADHEVETFLLIDETIKFVTNTFENNAYALNTTVSDLIKLTNALFTWIPAVTDSNTSNSNKRINAAVASSTINPFVAYYALSVLLRMLAPITPAFASQSWEDLHTPVPNLNSESITFPCNSTPSPVPDIFSHPFPTRPLSASAAVALATRRKTITCAVQVNGKLRFSLEIPTFASASLHRNQSTTGGEVEQQQINAEASTSTSTSRTGQEGPRREHEEEYLTAKILETEQGRYWLQERNQWEKRKRVIVVGGGKLVNVVF